MGSRSKATVVGQHDIGAFKSGGALSEKKKGQLLRKKKRNRDRMNESEIGKVDCAEDALHEQNGEHRQGKKEDGKLRETGRRTEKTNKAGIDKVSMLRDKVEEVSKEENGMLKFLGREWYDKVEEVSKEENGESRKARRIKKGRLSSKKEEKVLEMSKCFEPPQDEVYEISSGDEDCSRGMRKWITEYHQSRSGLETLQQRVDDFMTAHEEQQKQARKEQEALAAAGGWTVVVHHKGRKKTTETESGVAVGSVAQAAVLEREAKKKSKTKDVGVDFYRFQKREAQRSEIMALQSKFEQDKKRIQQLRAARKFRPY